MFTGELMEGAPCRTEKIGSDDLRVQGAKRALIGTAIPQVNANKMGHDNNAVG